MRSVESWMLSYLVNSLWQVPLVFAAGWVAARWLEKVSVLAEHRVWVGALCLEALLPAVGAVPRVPLERWSSLLVWGSEARGSDGQVSVVMGAGSGVGSLGLPGWLWMAIAMVYGGGVVYFTARLIWKCWKLVELRRGAVNLVLHGEAARVWDECLLRFEIEDVALGCSSEMRGPVALGVRRKLVLMPLGMASSLPKAELYAVIAHEFAHLRRNDFLKNLVYEVLSILVSYHPLLWMTQQRVRESREVVCDEMAAEVGGRKQYARSLLRLASLVLEGGRKGHAIGIAVGIFDANVFERRVMRLTKREEAMKGMRRVAVMVGCAALAVVCCGAAVALSMPVDSVAGMGVEGQAKANPKSINVSSGVMAGNRLSGSAPAYPEEAKKQRIQGTVVLSAVISKEGEVENLQVVSGAKELQQSSLDAVKDWKYRPYLLNGEPIEVDTTINVVYSLGK